MEAISALQESNQDVTKEINKGRLGLGAQGSRISTAEDTMKTLSTNYQGLSKSYKKHTKALYELIKVLTSEVESITAGNVANDPNEFDDFMDTSPRDWGRRRPSKNSKRKSHICWGLQIKRWTASSSRNSNEM
eukprot:scaffold26997_cov42-Attheya_sp.AAC.3